jgi:uncharacterized protein YndB with AHSA1/START domain
MKRRWASSRRVPRTYDASAEHLFDAWVDKESVVTIELTARGKQTDLVLTHQGLPTEALTEDHRGGWSQFLESLVERLK